MTCARNRDPHADRAGLRCPHGRRRADRAGDAGPHRAASGRRHKPKRTTASRRASPCATRSRAISASARRSLPSCAASTDPSHAATIAFVEKLLRDVFGFADMRRVGTRTLGERQFAVTLKALGGRVPVVVVPPSDDLDHPSAHLPSDGRRRSAASAVQDWLNAERRRALGPVHATASCSASCATMPA